MSILSDTSGEFVFLVQEGPYWDPKYKEVIFTDLKDIPNDFEYDHVIKFVGNIPPPPHTIEQHQRIAMYEKHFKRFMNRR